jgi:hypothetical protein
LPALFSPALPMFTLDLRKIDKRSLLDQIRRLEISGPVSVVRNSDQTMDVYPTASAPPHAEPLVLTSDPLPTTSTQGLAQLDRTLALNVKSINESEAKPKMANITGATALGNQFRTLLAGVKAQLDQASSDMNSAMTELTDTASQATAMVKQVKAETADLKAALGLSSNNPPA